MANNYTASRRTWKWTKKLFFHLLDLTIVNSHILLSSCGGNKISHRNFRLTLIREMLARARHEPRPSMHLGRPAPTSTNIGRLDTTHNKHWPTRNHPKARCRVCSARGVSWCSNVSSATWRFVQTEILSNITTQRRNFETSFRSSSVQTDEASNTRWVKERLYLQVCLEFHLLYYAIRDI
jgi:hypothetical protein